MPRKGQRETLDEGISRDGSGFSVRASVGSGSTRRSRERRFPPTVDLAYLRAQRAQLESELRAEALEQDGPRPERGTFAADVHTYLSRIKAHLDTATYKGRCSEMKAWTQAVGGSRPRHHVKRADIERIIGQWREDVGPKTILNRVRSLRHMYRVLEGPHAKTPADGVAMPAIPRSKPRPIARATIRRVIANLIRKERRGHLRDAKVRARFLVLVTTGQRPSQLRRTTAADIDLKRRVWWVPPGKGGEPIPLYLNDDMLAAWTLFVAADAWGEFDGTSFVKMLRKCGWPSGLRVYAARHAVGIDLSEKGVDLADIQAFLGHRWIQTTRDFYVPMLLSRVKAASEQLENRVGIRQKWARFAGTPAKPKKQKA